MRVCCALSVVYFVVVHRRAELVRRRVELVRRRVVRVHRRVGPVRRRVGLEVRRRVGLGVHHRVVRVHRKVGRRNKVERRVEHRKGRRDYDYEGIRTWFLDGRRSVSFMRKVFIGERG
ncbi:hypothetical protein HanRHA438_Chr01g0012721 [Helianthus annuus]|nr:hypothetical protein HanRHA438_Chr01g0012721 [Helianthus annuus]